MNDFLLEWCIKEAERKTVPYTKEKVAEMWAKEKKYLHHLPEQRFEACKLVSCQVNKTSLISIETNRYSVPYGYVGKTVWANFFVNRVIVVAQNQVIAEHLRSNERNQLITVLDHYLEEYLNNIQVPLNIYTHRDSMIGSTHFLQFPHIYFK
ncbi:hypothetical protein SAMN05192533_11776 [Mesobacillus persicus]|uniref:Transposase for insertion sequence element IS21-like C-terminal domain-containing protein n=1 Tax=Mesobacillus persicus TaxID=930146 RepID=A0A1H8IK38_9BACI|nr:hypothetical protein [Mesobacillus persicus]SEN68814.1 hypothetical protein SAMN05192533_11776 [Mesobacillus persicus]